MLTRRTWIGLMASALPAALVWPRTAHAGLPEATRTALANSEVVYLTPLKSDGAESKCKAEIWFVEDGGSVFVVTASTAWRARAIAKGLTKARLWVGDFGTWTKANDAFRSAPMLETVGSVVTEADVQSRVLGHMGEKFRSGWLVWGPRFRDGIKDGSRVMLRYTPV